MALCVCARPLAILLCRRNETAALCLPPPPSPPLTTASCNKTRWNDQLPDHPFLSLFSLARFPSLCPTLAPPLSPFISSPRVKIRGAALRLGHRSKRKKGKKRKERKGEKRIDIYGARLMSHGTLEPAGLMAPGAEMILSFSPLLIDIG